MKMETILNDQLSTNYKNSKLNLLQYKLLKELDKIVKYVLTMKNIKKIILFGSLAKKDISILSDIDLLIIWDTSMNFKERNFYLYDKIDSTEALDLLVYSPEEIEKMKNRNLFLKHVLKYGKVLYEKQ
jgi:uncharacterized protein